MTFSFLSAHFRMVVNNAINSFDIDELRQLE